jgi:hypothetical protein
MATPIIQRCRHRWRRSAPVLEMNSPPGTSWLEIVSRSTLGAFSGAFSENPILEATVLVSPLVGARVIHEFFNATRLMFERIAFIHETRSTSRTCLEWDGVFQGRDISGATIIAYDVHGAIEHIRLYHFPLEQLHSFAIELSRRLAGNQSIAIAQRPKSSLHSLIGVNHENER